MWRLKKLINFSPVVSRSLPGLGLILIASISCAQVISVYRSSPVTGWQKTLSSGSSVGFPTVGAGSSTLQFTIRNTGTNPLILNGSPAVGVSGANAALFSVSQPTILTLPANASTNFTVTYSTTDSLLHSAQLSILSNDTATPFVVNLSGAGNLFYGDQFPPPGSYPYFYSQSGNIGRPGGWNLVISSLGLGLNTPTYWGTSIASNGDLHIRLSMNGSSFTGDENMTFSPAESNLPGGSLVWRGNTILNTLNGNVFVYLKCILTTSTNGAIPFPLMDPAMIGLSEETGGLIFFNNFSDSLFANFIILASTNNSTFTPYLDFYDSYPKKTCGSCAYVSLTEGFYWKDLRPLLTANYGLTLPEGDSATITTALLNCTDAEDLPLHPERLVFSFMTSPPDPLAFGTGVLRKNGIPMTLSSPFTLQDLQNNLISYVHDGSETIHDEFQFSLKDGSGLPARDGSFTVFNFPVTITPVNDPPVTHDTSFTVSYGSSFSRTLLASDPDNTSLIFSIVSDPGYGTIPSFNPATGGFTYIPATGVPATDSFAYIASDGFLNSDTSLVNIHLVNMPPVSQNLSATTHEEVPVSGQLVATDPEEDAISFSQMKSPDKGIVMITAGGQFTYTPAATRMGTDYFTFRAQDAYGGNSVEDTVFIHIIPRLDPGDILVTDAANLRIFDPATSQDTILSRNGLLSQTINLVFGQGTSVFVYDAGSGLVKINPADGTQVLISPKSVFSSGMTGGPMGMILDNTGKVVIADGPNGIVCVDSTTGVVTPLFNGGFLQFPTALAFLNNGDLIVADAAVLLGGANRIIKITPAGVQTSISSGGYLSAPTDLVLVDQNTIAVADPGSFLGGTDRIIRVDLITGTQTVLSSGGLLSAPTGIDFLDDNLYVVNNSGAKKIVKIDYSGGSQTDITTRQMIQPWGLETVASGIPSSRSIQNAVVPYNNSYCYNALQTITIAGGNSYFIVMNGGNATLIAGQKILLRNVTLVLNGGRLHAYIAPGGPWCYTPSLPVQTAVEEEPLSASAGNLQFTVFPNPTNGNFRIFLKAVPGSGHVAVQLFGLRGEQIFKGDMNGMQEKEFNISSLPSGLFILRIVSEEGTGIFRIIKAD